MTKRNTAILFVWGLLMTTALHANIYGSPPTQLPTLDTCSGCLFAYIQFPSTAAGQSILSYQFYNGAGAGTSNYLTPILLEQTATRTFKVLAVGESSTGFAAGTNSVAFVLAAGTNQIEDANTFFGYVDGSVDSSGNITPNTGTITSNYPTGPGSTSYFAGLYSALPPLTVGQSINSFSAFTDNPPGQNNRTYSLQVTTTPEPGMYGALALGLSGVVVVLTRRRKA